MRRIMLPIVASVGNVPIGISVEVIVIIDDNVPVSPAGTVAPTPTPGRSEY